MKVVAVCFVVVGSATLCRGALMYNNTTPPAIPSFGNLDPNCVMLDDVFIPNSRLNGQSWISVKQATVGLFAPVPGTITLKAWFDTASVVNGKLTANFPPVQFASGTVKFPQGNTAYDLNFGDGSTELFRAPLLSGVKTGYQVFFFGLSFGQTINQIGWRTANGPDFNVDGFIGYYGPNDPRNGFKTFGQGIWGSFNLKLNGAPVPEPASLLSLVVGLVAVVRKRRRI